MVILIMTKHGAEMHFVRPDGVYRTSVLQAIPGYQPVSNAHAIAARFTSAPYFATALNGNFYGNLPFWDRVRLRWANTKARWQANRVRAMTAQVAVLAPPIIPDAPPSPITAGLLPAVDSRSPEAMKYGIGPANEAMAKVGLKITQGLVQTGADAMPPSIAVPESNAAQRIAPQAATDIRQLAAMVQNRVPGYAGERAFQAAIDRWQRQRSMWWYQNS